MFTKRQEAELIISIQGRAEVPLKFNYFDEGAKGWEKIAKARMAEGINHSEFSLLSNRAEDFLKSFLNLKKINVIDIGCGDGTPVLPLLEILNKKNIDFRYVPLDISSELLQSAEKNISKLYPSCEVKKILLDFELGNFSDLTYELKSDGSSNLLLFLGSTLGNFSDRNRVLTNMRDSMGSDDFLIVGVEMTNFAKINKIIQSYDSELVRSWLYTLPEKINIKRKDTKYEVKWNEKESQIEIWIDFQKEQFLKIGKEKFNLGKDEKLLLARSVKFNEWTFTKLMSEVGFRTEILTTSKDRGYVLSMVQPTRFSMN